MAKRGILFHSKTIDLAERLGIPEVYAVGVLEAFWQHVARCHPEGDITALRPSLLARSIQYPADAQTLWQSLIEVGFLDAKADGRILVHEWSEHADNSVHQLLKKRGTCFADGARPFGRGKPAATQTVQESNGQEPERFTNGSQTVHEPVTNDSRLPKPKPKPSTAETRFEEPERACGVAVRTEPLEPPNQVEPETRKRGETFWASLKGWFENANGLCPDTYQLRCLWDTLGWLLDHGETLDEALLDAGLENGRRSTGRRLTVSPKALEVGVRIAVAARAEAQAKQDETARCVALAASEDRAAAAAIEQGKRRRREFNDRLDRAALAGPDSPEWAAWLAELPDAPRTQRDLLRMRRKDLLSRGATAHYGAQ